MDTAFSGTTTRTASTRTPGLPRLEAGDHLDRQTFHERYEAMPRAFRAELIRGVVIVPSPVSPLHARAHRIATTWCGVYIAATPGKDGFDNGSIFASDESEPQPDVSIIISPEFGGKMRPRQDDEYLDGAPELIVEVAVSSAAYDLFEKFDVYEQAGVLEYVVHIVQEQEIRWFQRQEDKFVPLAMDADGIFRSRVFPGLWLNAAAAVQAEDATMLQTLQQGLASPEHKAFVEELQRRGPAKT